MHSIEPNVLPLHPTYSPQRHLHLFVLLQIAMCYLRQSVFLQQMSVEAELTTIARRVCYVYESCGHVYPMVRFWFPSSALPTVSAPALTYAVH